MKIEVNLNDADTMLIEDYAKKNNLELSEFARRAMLESIIDDDYCLYLYERGMEEYKKNPTTYTLNEVKEKLGLS